MGKGFIESYMIKEQISISTSEVVIKDVLYVHCTENKAADCVLAFNVTYVMVRHPNNRHLI